MVACQLLHHHSTEGNIFQFLFFSAIEFRAKELNGLVTVQPALKNAINRNTTGWAAERTMRIKWVWAATRTWAAAARTMRTTRRKAPGRRKGATRSERRKFSSTVILFCLHTQYTLLLFCQHPLLSAILLANTESRCENLPFQ